MRLAVTGTDTGVGKTIVAAALLAMLRRDGLRVAGMKPVEPGLVHGDAASDAELLREAAGEDDCLEDVCPVSLAGLGVPPVGELLPDSGNTIPRLDAAFARLAAGRDTILVEDPSGLLVPVVPGVSFDHLARRWNLDLLVVAADRPGLIHHILLVARAARESGLRVRGVVVNELYADQRGAPELVTNDALVAALPGVPVCRFPFVARPLDQSALAAAASNAGLDALRSPVAALPAHSQSPLADAEGEEARA
jgi:dethiobiotin synthetase